MHPLTGVADARLSWSAGQRPAGEPWHRRAGRVRWRGRAAVAQGTGPSPVQCRAHAQGAGSHPTRCRVHAPPGHIRPRAASMPKALGHNRPRAASMASPGHADAGCGPASAGRRVPLTTAPVPAHASRLLQVVLLRVAATPRTLTDPLSHATTHQVHPAIQVPTRPPPATAGTGVPRQRHSRAPPPPVRHPPSLPGRGPGGRSARLPSLGACSWGG